jgi:hypothetical protein
MVIKLRNYWTGRIILRRCIENAYRMLALLAIMLWWVCMAPLGMPVLPLVLGMIITSLLRSTTTFSGKANRTFK